MMYKLIKWYKYCHTLDLMSFYRHSIVYTLFIRCSKSLRESSDLWLSNFNKFLADFSFFCFFFFLGFNEVNESCLEWFRFFSFEKVELGVASMAIDCLESSMLFEPPFPLFFRVLTTDRVEGSPILLRSSFLATWVPKPTGASKGVFDHSSPS
jgi:hypothetical protein